MLLAWKPRPRLARGLLVADLVLIYVLSLSPVAYLLNHTVEAYPVLPPAEVRQFGAQAIVLLGAGAGPEPEQGAVGPGGKTLRRARYAAFLYHQTGLPVVVCGGGVSNEATAMTRALEQTGVPSDRIFQEGHSRSTFENAILAAPILREHGWKKVLLVSHSLHLRRAVPTFERTGVQVVPAPCEQVHTNPFGSGIYALLPQFEALHASCQALEEALALVFYRLRYRDADFS